MASIEADSLYPGYLFDKFNLSNAISFASRCMSISGIPSLRIASPARVRLILLSAMFSEPSILLSSRLISVLADKFNVKTEDLQGFVVGEHGDSQIVDWNSVKICGLSIEEYCASKGIPFKDDDKEEIAEIVKKYGMTIISGKGRTNYGIATSVCVISEAILKNKGRVLSVALPDDDIEATTSKPYIVDAK